MTFIKNKNILIFGKNSFIGTYLIKRLEKNNNLVFFEQKHNKININNFNKRKINLLLKNNNFDYIINFHAHTDINQSNIDSYYDFYHNCSIIHSIVESIIKNKCNSFFLNFGTATQIGFTDSKKKINNLYRGQPETIFDLHKQYNEDYISIKKKIHNFSALTLRLCNIYGVGSTFSKSRGIVNKMVDSSLKNKQIFIYGNGNFVRDFLYIDDLIDAILLTLKNYKKLNKDFYYISYGKGNSFKSLAKYIASKSKKYVKENIKIVYQKWPKKINKIEKRSFVGNNIEFKKITGWKPRYNLSKGIEQMIKTKLIKT